MKKSLAALLVLAALSIPASAGIMEMPPAPEPTPTTQAESDPLAEIFVWLRSLWIGEPGN